MVFGHDLRFFGGFCFLADLAKLAKWRRNAARVYATTQRMKDQNNDQTNNQNQNQNTNSNQNPNLVPHPDYDPSILATPQEWAEAERLRKLEASVAAEEERKAARHLADEYLPDPYEEDGAKRIWHDRRRG
ncbi:MAG: hypothetical protein JWR69_3488 [Pedosphaera sp.]|nr:hypothetical protein [Pedosphaera sp.]